MTIREANRNDVDQLIELRKKMLIEEEDMIISTCGVCFYQLPPSFKNPTGRNAYIVNVYTEQQYRNRGIATKLLKMTLDGVKQLGFKVVRLHASEEGKSIYKKIGFIASEGYMFIRI